MKEDTVSYTLIHHLSKGVFTVKTQDAYAAITGLMMECEYHLRLLTAELGGVYAINPSSDRLSELTRALVDQLGYKRALRRVQHLFDQREQCEMQDALASNATSVEVSVCGEQTSYIVENSKVGEYAIKHILDTVRD